MKTQDLQNPSLWSISQDIDGNKKQKKETLKNTYANKILEILHPKFVHPYANITRTTFSTLFLEELIQLHVFLIDGILLSPTTGLRFPCPITTPLSQSRCRYDYKLGMIEYISTFGYKFPRQPCSYTPALLESVANYCEHIRANSYTHK